MRTDELALDYIERAEMTLEEARSAMDNEIYSLAIRRSQETVELSLKAALRYLAIEYPRDHDVSDVLFVVKETRKLPNWFEEKIEFMASASRDLARKRVRHSMEMKGLSSLHLNYSLKKMVQRL